MGRWFVNRNKSLEAEKWLFSKFSLLLHIYSSRRNFFVFTKISYLQPFREIMGGQTKLQFSTKNDATGQKKWLFSIFFLLSHIYTLRRNFFVFIKISYLQPFREIMGGQEKSVTSNNDERRTTNDERRTTLTIIIPRQDSQNPRANNCSLLFNFTYNLLCRRWVYNNNLSHLIK